jgi:hypothetical protein
MAARILAAATIIGVVIWIGMTTGNSSIFVYNGLGRAVTVQVGSESAAIPSCSHREIGIGDRTDVHFTTRTLGRGTHRAVR